MDIGELRKEPHLSASSITDYMECGLLYKFSRIDKIKMEHRPDALEFGSTIHKVLADMHLEKLTGSLPTLEEVLEVFELYWKEAAEDKTDIKYKEGKNFEVLLAEGKELIRCYYENSPRDDFNIIAIEEPFRITLDGLEIPILGVWDMVTEDDSGAIVITDWKTAAKSYTSNDVDRNFQLTLYHMAARMNGFSKKEIILKFDVLIKTKKPRFEQYWTTRGEMEERRALKKIQEVWRGISNGVFIPNDSSWKCPMCAYKRYCEEWFEN